MGKHERRSAKHARPDNHGSKSESISIEKGVGARQCELFAFPEGGGYLNECTSSELQEGAKIREFSDMGLPAFWVRLAEAIGYDNFLIFWRMADTAAEFDEIRRSENESMIELQLRRYSSYKRYQRNRYIESLAANGLPNAVIQQTIKRELGENLDRSHIRRLAKPGRMPE